MANTVETQTIHDGPRNLVVKVHLHSDGVAGELSGQSIIDISAYQSFPGFGAPTSCRIKKVQSNLSGFTGELLWDATANKHALNIPDYEFNGDYTKIGGIPNDAGAGVTGDVLISTNGFTAATDTGHIILELIKQYG